MRSLLLCIKSFINILSVEYIIRITINDKIISNEIVNKFDNTILINNLIVIDTLKI